LQYGQAPRVLATVLAAIWREIYSSTGKNIRLANRAAASRIEGAMANVKISMNPYDVIALGEAT
jgi:hypothetical protein